MKNKLILIGLLLASTSLSAQLKKGDKAFDNLEYYEAIEYYTNYLKKEVDLDVSTRLIECYYYTNQLSKAEERLQELEPSFGRFTEMQYLYAKILLVTGKAKESKVQIQSFLEGNPDDKKAQIILKSCNIYDKLLAEKDGFIIDQSMSINGSHYSPAYYGRDKLLFTSESATKIDKWTGRPYTMLFTSDLNGNNMLALPGNLNGKYHNGAATIVNDSEIFYTRNSKKKSKGNVLNLEIVQALKSGDEWKFKGAFDFNKKECSTAYPSISADGNTMIFSSDREGGFGGFDLYMSTYHGDGSWGLPRNLGPNVNSIGDEVFPNFTDGEKLYYASDGFAGLGGLDLFFVSREGNDWSYPTNVGAPINSSYDDFGLITRDDMKTGYFSSNRNTKSGVDQILSFTKKKAKLDLSGIVVDKFTGIPLPGVNVVLENTTTGLNAEKITGSDGRFHFDVTEDQSYIIEGMKNGIATTKESVIVRDDGQKLYFKLLHNDPRFTLNGMAQNIKTKEGVEGVSVRLFNLNTNMEEVATTDAKGDFHFQLEQNTDYEISGVKDGYYTSISEATTKGLDRSTTLYVKLFLTIEDIVIGETKIIGKEKIGGWDFDPIYYDLDESYIRPDASLVLDKIFDFLQLNPKLNIELGAHTDARASEEYNSSLSERRALAAKDYLVKRGILLSRISSRGYGETVLTNHCRDGVDCSEEMHQLNRRTEIKILGLADN